MKREVWVDYIKILACVLVVLGHFFQSMMKASIMPDDGPCSWFNTTIYYFHVPLFFICSGYLYQRYSRVIDGQSWIRNVGKKAVVLGIPYFVFSTATWLLKTVFSGSMNSEIGGIAETLFLQPTSPYWYLYILFFIFLITPTVKNVRGGLILTAVALVIKALRIGAGDDNTAVWQIYTIQGVCANEIWFVLGMILAVVGAEKIKRRIVGVVLGIVFIIISLWSYKNENGWIGFGMGLLACAAVFMMIAECKENRTLNRFVKYTMPIFLMHTLFAAPTRVALLKIGINSPAIHVLVGILISFIGPIVTMWVLEKIKLDWLVYPGKLLKRRT